MNNWTVRQLRIKQKHLYWLLNFFLFHTHAYKYCVVLSEFNSFILCDCKIENVVLIPWKALKRKVYFHVTCANWCLINILLVFDDSMRMFLKIFYVIINLWWYITVFEHTSILYMGRFKIIVIILFMKL